MLRQILLYLLPLFNCATGIGQNAYLDIVEELPNELDECSGLAYLPGGRLAMINDSGNDPEIFITDTSGQLLTVLEHPEIENEDWEELAYANGTLFIGDFGNNANKRDDLKIFMVTLSPELEIGKVEVIEFSYANQESFPPEDENKNFDMEAMVAMNDSLYLFSKNRTEPFDGRTYVYALPQQAGKYQLSPKQSFSTGTGPRECYWICGASLNSRADRLYLLGYQQMWVFENEGSDFFSKEPKVIRFDEVSQKEAITVLPGGQVMIADERNMFSGGLLYRLRTSVDHH